MFRATRSAPLQSEEPGSRLWECQDPRVPTSPTAPHTAWVLRLQGVLSKEAPQLGAHGPLGVQASVGGGWLPAWVLSDNESSPKIRRQLLESPAHAHCHVPDSGRGAKGGTQAQGSKERLADPSSCGASPGMGQTHSPEGMGAPRTGHTRSEHWRQFQWPTPSPSQAPEELSFPQLSAFKTGQPQPDASTARAKWAPRTKIAIR